MKSLRRSFGFRDDAITWIKNRGFYYVEFYGWCHENGYSAIVEQCGRAPHPWVLTVYRNAVPPKPQENLS